MSNRKTITSENGVSAIPNLTNEVGYAILCLETFRQSNGGRSQREQVPQWGARLVIGVERDQSDGSSIILINPTYQRYIDSAGVETELATNAVVAINLDKDHPVDPVAVRESGELAVRELMQNLDLAQTPLDTSA